MNNDSRSIDSAPEVNTPDRAPDCLRCRYFKITWEPSFPHACLLFGVKTRSQPSTEVFLSTGKHCFSFQLNEKLTANPKDNE